MTIPEADIQPSPQEPPAAPEADGLLLRYLHDRDADCPVCGYNLRNLTSSRCPECGREIILTVGAAEPYLRPWLTAMVSLCACAGVGLLFVLLIVLEGLPPAGHWQHAVLLFVLAIPLAIALVASYRRFLKMSHPPQRAIAAAAVIYAGITFIVLVLAILD